MDINIKHEATKFQGLYYWSAISRWALIVFAALTPIFFLPVTNLPVAANKEILVFALILISFFALLGKILVEGRVRYPGHLLTGALAALVVVWGVSAFLSFNQYISLIGYWSAPDSFFAILLFSILAYSIAATFNRRDIIVSLLIFSASLSLLGIFELLQLAKIFILPFDFAKNAGFNPIGSINEVGVLMAFGLVLVSGLLSSSDLSKLLKRCLSLAAVIFILNLVVINFWAIWVGLILAMIFLISFLSAGLTHPNPPLSGRELESSPDKGRLGGVSEINGDDEIIEYHGLQLAYFQKAWLPSVILLISLLLLFIPPPFARFIQTPVEVSPSFNATWNIGFENLKAGNYLLGSGSNTFGYIFNLYKSAGINQTIFWSTVFNGGASAFASWIGTVGILGILALLFLIVAFIWNGIAGASVRNSSRGIMSVASQTTFIGVCFLFVMWFLYATNFTLMAFAFWGIGLFAAASFFFTKEENKVSGSEIKIFTSPPKTFLFSLLFVGLMALSIMGLYFEANRYAAEISYSKGDYVSAVNFWQYDERYFQGLSQSIFIQLNDLLANKDLPQETLRTEFQNITTNAISAARQAQTLNPRNSFNDVLLGNIYENLIPFIADAANFALSSYSGAIALDPQNPSNYLALARVKVAKEDLDGAVADLEKAIDLKNDYTPVRFLLVQVYDQQGKLADAIKRAEELVSLNVNDVGALFQLGFLYYKNNQFEEAKPVFERAVELSPNYSNARYFLGLIYDRDAATKERALEQFNRIAELNPDNNEVKQIIANLTAKKPALFGVTPPAPAPQNRTEAPISEGTEAPVQPIKK
ncbi:tetratricopeptide repeat protein [Patescibacteria group bacterium]|nr:tetratricopeptide repeat protein [Patescibacteria group bacterium]